MIVRKDHTAIRAIGCGMRPACPKPMHAHANRPHLYRSFPYLAPSTSASLGFKRCSSLEYSHSVCAGQLTPTGSHQLAHTNWLTPIGSHLGRFPRRCCELVGVPHHQIALHTRQTRTNQHQTTPSQHLARDRLLRRRLLTLILRPPRCACTQNIYPMKGGSKTSRGKCTS